MCAARTCPCGFRSGRRRDSSRDSLGRLNDVHTDGGLGASGRIAATRKFVPPLWILVLLSHQAKFERTSRTLGQAQTAFDSLKEVLGPAIAVSSKFRRVQVDGRGA